MNQKAWVSRWARDPGGNELGVIEPSINEPSVSKETYSAHSDKPSWRTQPGIGGCWMLGRSRILCQPPVTCRAAPSLSRLCAAWACKKRQLQSRITHLNVLINRSRMCGWNAMNESFSLLPLHFLSHEIYLFTTYRVVGVWNLSRKYRGKVGNNWGRATNQWHIHTQLWAIWNLQFNLFVDYGGKLFFSEEIPQWHRLNMQAPYTWSYDKDSNPGLLGGRQQF